MTETRKTGIYIGNQAFYFAKLEDKTGNNFFEVPFGISGERVQILTDKSIEILDLTANIKKALDENRVTAAQAHLALPAHEIIFRSFNVPFMQPQEVKNVVAFEASKYVPFKLDELIYTYYPLTTTENKRRVIRVLFAAVKKERIQTYSYLFSQAGFSIEHIEPGFFSLLRALTFKKQLPANKTIGIIECYPNEGRIIILDQNIPQFVREFQIFPTSLDAQALSTDVQRIRFFNEIKISLDYYGRQFNHKKIDKLIALTRNEMNETLAGVGRDLEISTTILNASSLLNIRSEDFDIIPAYGASLHDSVKTNIKFDFPWRAKPEIISVDVQEGEASLNIKSMAITAGACAGILFLVFQLGTGLQNNRKQKLAQLEAQLGPYASAKAEGIDKQAAELKAKLESYKSIKLRSRVAYFLRLLPNLLPEGVWISDLDINHDNTAAAQPEKSGLAISFNGYAYLEEVKEQFTLIDNLVMNLKKNKDFSATFDKIELSSVELQNLQQYQTTSFRITCR